MLAVFNSPSVGDPYKVKAWQTFRLKKRKHSKFQWNVTNHIDQGDELNTFFLLIFLDFPELLRKAGRFFASSIISFRWHYLEVLAPVSHQTTFFVATKITSLQLQIGSFFSNPCRDHISNTPVWPGLEIADQCQMNHESPTALWRRLKSRRALWTRCAVWPFVDNSCTGGTIFLKDSSWFWAASLHCYVFFGKREGPSENDVTIPLH